MQKPSPSHRLLILASLLAALPAAAAPDNITALGMLNAGNSGYSMASAVSANGRTVVGESDNDDGYRRAVVWSGSGWGSKTDLGTHRTDNSGNSSALDVRTDSSVVVGEAAGDTLSQHAHDW